MLNLSAYYGHRFGDEVCTALVARCCVLQKCLLDTAGKSWEGTAGGVGLSIAVALLAVHYLPLGRSFGLPAAALFGALMAPLSLAGDLCESYLKRWAGQKDSNNLIPEFGGVLDIVDSLTFCVPAGYYLLILFYKT